jgi:hypothetical protein
MQVRWACPVAGAGAAAAAWNSCAVYGVYFLGTHIPRLSDALIICVRTRV